MLAISRILVPVDFSARCLGMIPYIKAIAAKYNAEVVLLHVVIPYYTIPPTAFTAPAMIPLPASAIPEREKQMAEFAVAELEGITTRRLVYVGDPASQIVAHAKAENVSLIAMPTRGHGVLRRFLIGSETSKILHDVACPVLTGVHLEERAGPESARYSNVLCAVDLGPQSRETLAWASRIAADFGAKLRIVHTITPVNPGVVVGLSSDFQLELEKLASREIQKLQSATGTEAANVHIEEGEAARTVCSIAQSSGADLLVIGRGAAQEGETERLRTNAYAIIRLSPCPVISV